MSIRKVILSSSIILAALILTLLVCAAGMVGQARAAEAVLPWETDLANASAAPTGGIPFAIVDTDPSPTGSFLYNANKLARDSFDRLYVAYPLQTQQFVPWYNYLRWSDNDGGAWSDAVRPDKLPDSLHSPSLAIKHGTTLVQSFSFNVSQHLSYSLDRGTTWWEAGFFDCCGYGTTSLAVDLQGTLHVAYFKRADIYSGPYNLFYRNSNDYGLTWSDPVTLTELTGDGAATYPEITTGAGGWLYITYLARPSSTGPFNAELVYFDGSAWSQPLALSSPGAASLSVDQASDADGLLHLFYSQYNSSSSAYTLQQRTFNSETLSLSGAQTMSAAFENIFHVTTGAYAHNEIVVAYDVFTGTASSPTFQGVYARKSNDAFTSRLQVSTHPNARDPILRYSQNFMYYPQKQDIIWLEPNDVSGGIMVVHGMLAGRQYSRNNLQVNSWSPKVVNPGQDVLVLIQYQNTLTTTAQDVVVQALLPPDLTFMAASAGGIRRAEANEVYWILGDLAPGASGYLTLELNVPWGMPEVDVEVPVRIASPSLAANIFDPAFYISFVPLEGQIQELSLVDIDALLAGDAELRSLLEFAIEQGYRPTGTGEHVTRSDGEVVTRLALLRFGETLESGWLVKTTQAIFVNGVALDYQTFFDRNGGLRQSSLDGSIIYWGSWGAGNPGLRLEQVDSSYEGCLLRCGVNEAQSLMWSKVSATWSLVSAVKNCAVCLDVSTDAGSKECIKCVASAAKICGAAIPLASESASLGYCLGKCYADPNFFDPCKAGDTLYEQTNNLFRIAGGGLFGPLRGKNIEQCYQYFTCDPASGNWAGKGWVWNTPAGVDCCPRGQVLVSAKKNEVKCEKSCPMPMPQLKAYPMAADAPGSTLQEEATCDTDEIKIVPAHDPNAKAVAPSGDVLPGQMLSYTVEYENTGLGIAYEVYIIDQLDPNLDDNNSLVIQNGGLFYPASRQIFWDIGTLLPGQQGKVTFQVNVKATTPNGTQIINTADVHFPSAGEVTPTNAVINTVRTLVATPQEIESIAGLPVDILLEGQDLYYSPLTYTITSEPLYGVLTGTLPALTYLPMDDQPRLETFEFTVSNWLETSDPAKVTLHLLPDPNDSLAPQVVSTYPADNQTGVLVYTQPVTLGMYLPALQVRFSEPISAATVTSATFNLNGVPGDAFYDTLQGKAYFYPAQPLATDTTYTAALSSGIRDLIGNPLAGTTWSFTTQPLRALRFGFPGAQPAWDFGLLYGTAPVSQTVNLISEGLRATTIQSVSLSGPARNAFTIDDSCTGERLERAQSCALVIWVNPLLLRTTQLQLSVLSDAPTITAPVRAAKPTVWLPCMRR